MHHETRADRRLLRNPGDPGQADESAADPPVALRRTMLSSIVGNEPPPLPPTELRPGSLVEAAIREELDQRDRSEARPSGAAGATLPGGAAGPAGPTPGSRRDGLFAAAPQGEASPRPAVADALAGITLPCGLSPVIDPSGLDPHRVCFLTTGVPAAQVGREVGDEVERLGYALRSDSAAEAIATRDGVEIRIIIHPVAPSAVTGSVRLFPNAPADSVAVEFRT
jgi:hypothetical protein